MPETPNTPSEDLKRLEQDAEILEDEAKQDGLLPDADDESGVGPQTGVVP